MLHISMLGEQVFRIGSEVLRARSSRSLGLVAFLVVHAGVPQPRPRIASALWPDSTDEQALTNLRRELHHLRQLLGGDPSLVADQRHLCWQDSATCDVDVRTFDQRYFAAIAAASAGDDAAALANATGAVSRYRGELMPGAYEDWILNAREDREQRCVELLDLLSAAGAAGDSDRAVHAARRRIQLRPFDEAGYRRLMELQGDLGDRAGAVSTFHHCASVLERELAVEPSPSTRAVLDRLSAAVLTPTPRPAPGRRRSGPADSDLIGREAEMGRLHAAWRAAAAGRTGVALVRGDPGVGKTRLAVDLAAAVRAEGAVVATAECFGSSGRLALAPVADWLGEPAIQAATAGLDPVWRVETERLVPASTASGESSDSSRAMVDAWQRHRFFEGLAQALGAVTRPLLLVLDNLQWCDQETLSFLTFFLGRRGTAPALLAGTVRNDDHEPALEEWMSRIRASSALTEIHLQPLDVSGTARLATAISTRPLTGSDAQLLHAATGGFPLYVVEAARGGAAHRTDALSLPIGDLGAVLDSRFAQLTPPAREIAGLAAAVGRDFSLDLLTEASDLQPDAVVEAVDELWRHRILRESGGGYDFTHDLLRERGYAAVSPPRRWLLHRRVAQGLELLHRDDQDSVSAQLAEQYVRGGRGGRAIAYFRRAADVAAARFAHAEAIRLHHQALAAARSQPHTPERDRQELELLEAIAAPLNARFGYSSLELEQVLARTIELAESLGRRESLLTALVGTWASQFVQGSLAASRRAGERALDLVPPGSDLSGPAHFAVAGSAFAMGRPQESVEHFALSTTESSTHLLTIGTRPDVHARAFVAHAHWLLGNSDAALTSAGEAIATARSNATPYNLAVALAYGAVTHQLCGDLPATLARVTELQEICERHDFAYYREWGVILRAWCQGTTADVDAARRGVASLVAQRALVRMPYWLSLLADLSERLGDTSRARADLDAALVSAVAREDVWWLPEVMRRRARYDAGAAAIDRLRAAVELAQAQGSAPLRQRCEADLSTRRSRAGTGVPDMC